MSALIYSSNASKLEPAFDPSEARTMAGRFIASTTFAKGTIIGQITAAGATQGQFKPYASGNTDGSQVAVGIVTYDFVTDANGNVILGPAGSAADLGRGNNPTAEFYYKGAFYQTELTGLDATAISSFKAREFGITGVGNGKVLYIP
ncbi:head decoration protein [Armatimonas rosea]|uniref:Bacteriophage lambda head decoration protein D n=1 Tax=Armatimonas rosea TaxID=685828 RepID=A0A7W9W9G6_ARMRO|nr:head decoration protein [Armatimonas rosea]MBB6053266.1 hypothetical protein [Armatimonas rosea]